MKIGDRVQDEVSGWKGVITGLAQYADGRNLAQVTAMADSNKIPAEWIPLHQLKGITYGTDPGFGRG